MKTAPAYQFYASDAMADKRYRLMTLAERGLYLSLLNECWVNHSIPADPNAIAKWLGYSPDEIKSALTERVLAYFKSNQGELTSPELERYRHELEERRDKLSQAGKKGVKAKQDKAATGASHPASLAQAPRVEKSRAENRKGELAVRPVIDDPWLNEYERVSNGI
jgi:uncharacterized protein YdaU (DUF1376 family)